ncbi:hypothetical protein C4884_10785, partial [Streptococcus agalactiae]
PTDPSSLKGRPRERLHPVPPLFPHARRQLLHLDQQPDLPGPDRAQHADHLPGRGDLPDRLGPRQVDPAGDPALRSGRRPVHLGRRGRRPVGRGLRRHDHQVIGQE